MAVDDNTLAKHPGRNPDHAEGMKARRAAQAHNKSAKEFNTLQQAMGSEVRMPLVPVPRQPSKYVPHLGKKELARHGK